MIQLDNLNLTLVDLRIDDEDKLNYPLSEEKKASVASCAEPFLRYLRSTNKEAAKESAVLFRAHSPFESVSVETMAHALEQVVDYATRRELWSRNDDWARGPECLVQAEKFEYIYYWYDKEDDDPCYDGGAGLWYVTVPRRFTFEYIGPEETVWSQKKESWKKSVESYIADRNRRQNCNRIDKLDQLMNRFRWEHGYHGCLENDDVPVLPYMSGTMLLLNPFGLPGVFRVWSEI